MNVIFILTFDFLARVSDDDKKDDKKSGEDEADKPKTGKDERDDNFTNFFFFEVSIFPFSQLLVRVDLVFSLLSHIPHPNKKIGVAHITETGFLISRFYFEVLIVAFSSHLTVYIITEEDSLDSSALVVEYFRVVAIHSVLENFLLTIW